MPEPTLSEFLLARIAEDEADAEYWHHSSDDDLRSLEYFGRIKADDSVGYDFRANCRCGGPERVLAECAAKRIVINEAWGDLERIDSEWGGCHSREELEADNDTPASVRALAAIYADHKDFRAEWK